MDAPEAEAAIIHLENQAVCQSLSQKHEPIKGICGNGKTGG